MLVTESDLKTQLMSDYNKSLDESGISGERLAQRLNAISKIGLTEQGGSKRRGFTKEEREAKDLLKKWMAEAGLEVREDGIGNLFGRLQGTDKNEKVILSGSHIDTVPNGGHFDGVLGVLSALEIVEAWNFEGYQPRKPFEVVAFTSEEGSRVNQGLLGSKGMVGELSKDNLRELEDFEGKPFEEILQENGLSFHSVEGAVINMDNIAAFFEVHIEQGKQLHKENLPVGIVTGIAGSCRVVFTFHGEAGHAGNTPMNDRKDALIAASDFIQGIEKLPEKISSSAVATVGKLDVFPNGTNVIPGKVELSVDMRDIDEGQRDHLVEMVIDLSKEISEKHEIGCTYEEAGRGVPLPINKEMQEKVAGSMKSLNMKPYFLPSGAGHDSLVIGKHVAVGMIFVKSIDGHSHTPKEWSTLNDCVQGVHVLKRLVEQENQYSERINGYDHGRLR